MVEITLVQGKLAPDMKTFEAETEMPVIYHSLDEALRFAGEFMRHVRPEKIISRWYDSSTKQYIEYETVRVYKVEFVNKDVALDWVIEGIEKNQEEHEEE